jgi:uncharacterized protein
MHLFGRQQINISRIIRNRFMSPHLLKPALYSIRADGSVCLRGGRCECGHVFFPMQAFGCEQCGRNGDALKPVELDGRGRLVASSLVHMHADAKRIAPFVVGTIALDDGPVVRTLLTVTSEPEIGNSLVRVRAVLVATPVEENSGGYLDLRFAVEAA